MLYISVKQHVCLYSEQALNSIIGVYSEHNVPHRLYIVSIKKGYLYIACLSCISVVVDLDLFQRSSRTWYLCRLYIGNTIKPYSIMDVWKASIW
jgi:hypothetical protein